MPTTFLTKEGFQKLQDELDFLRGAKPHLPSAASSFLRLSNFRAKPSVGPTISLRRLPCWSVKETP